MRLRQICLVAEELAPAVDELCGVLGIEVCYRDPDVAHCGLGNAVMPVRGNFLEIVAPVEPDTSAGRYLKRRGGNGGYMVILQCPDALAERERIAELGVRHVYTIDKPAYTATHFHPRDVGGILLSIDSVEPGADYTDPMCSWAPASRNWQIFIRTGRVGELAGVELQSDDPAAFADLWSRILDLPVTQDESANPVIELINGPVRFVPATDGRGAGVGGIDLQVADREAVLDAVRERNLLADGDQIIACGLRINLV